MNLYILIPKDCSKKNLVDFSSMGSALHKALYTQEESNVAILNIGSEEIKGHEVIKKAYEILNSKNNKSNGRQQRRGRK